MALVRFMAFAFAVAACRETPPEPEIPQAAAEGNPSHHEHAAEHVAGLAQEGWYGIYMMGNKVGSAHMWFRPTRDHEIGAFTYGFVMKMTVTGGGEANELTLEEHRYYDKAFPHPLIETRFVTGAKGFSEERTARPTDGGKMRISRVLGGANEPERVVAGTQEDLLAQLYVSPVELAEGDVGVIRRVSMWSWEKEADDPMSVVLEAIEVRQRAGVAERVGRLALTYEKTGVKGTVLVADGGTILEMTVGASLMLKLEERSVAESGAAGLDILGTWIGSPKKLGSAHEVAALRLDLSGPKELVLPASAGRTVEPLPPEGDRARWRLTVRRGPAGEVTAAERAEALASDATFDSAHPAIIARANELTRGITGIRDKVEAIASWVFRTLDKKLATHLPSASTVLEKKVGDCSEHSWLTVALLRAVGVPARPLYGVAYTGDGEAMFAYHAWVEVAVPDASDPARERWLAIDPTWGEPEADATHIVLGSSFGEVAGSIGGLKIEAAEIIAE